MWPTYHFFPNRFFTRCPTRLAPDARRATDEHDEEDCFCFCFCFFRFGVFGAAAVVFRAFPFSFLPPSLALLLLLGGRACASALREDWFYCFRPVGRSSLSNFSPPRCGRFFSAGRNASFQFDPDRRAWSAYTALSNLMLTPTIFFAPMPKSRNTNQAANMVNLDEEIAR